MKFSIISSIIFVLLVSGAFAAEILTTDINGEPKYDFAPQENVYIQGIGFVPDSLIDITIVRPDSSIESCDSSSCHYRYPQGQISSDEEGDFTIIYALNGIRGNYSVTVSDGTNTVYTTFLDARNILSATVNGAASATVDPGDSVLVSLTVQTTGSGINDDWKSTQYRIEGGSWTCVNTNDYTSAATNIETFNVNAPLVAGTYDLELIAHPFNLCLGAASNTFKLTDGIIVSTAVCGDLDIDYPEACEDNNTINGDGCSSVCQIEYGWECTSGVPSVCNEVCGNGIITQGETCDDNNDDDGDGCSSSCEVEEGWVCESEEEGDESECITINPELADACGLDVVLIIDSSASMSNSDISQIKTVLNGIANELLPSTPTQIAVVDFDNIASLLQDYTSNLTLIETAVNSISRNGFTNWEDALEEAHDEFNNRLDKPDLYIFAGGGNPNAHGDGPNLDFPVVATAFAVEDADQIKLDGVRMITLGFTNNPAESRLKEISSEDAYYSNSSFDALRIEIKEKAEALCKSYITVQKLVNGTATSGWEFSLNITGAGSYSGITNESGEIKFEITETVTANLTETLQQYYSVTDASCELDEDELGIYDGNRTIYGITIGLNQNVLCTFNNILLSHCGDNETQELNEYGGEEECDDGNLEDDDGCSAVCELEGVTSPVMPSVMLIFMLVALLVLGMKK